jgi:hypothetical protein
MMTETYIFDIGVYLTDEESFYARRNKELREQTQWLRNQVNDIPQVQVDIVSAQLEQHFVKNYGTWRYTQAIAWIRIYILGTQIRGETWFVEAKRLSRRLKGRVFNDDGKTFELDILDEDSQSIDIYTQVLNELNELKKQKPFKGRYIDLEHFCNLGPFINWRELMGFDVEI